MIGSTSRKWGSLPWSMRIFNPRDPDFDMIANLCLVL
jgi:hypothetical protein